LQGDARGRAGRGRTVATNIRYIHETKRQYYYFISAAVKPCARAFLIQWGNTITLFHETVDPQFTKSLRS
jgi:hypothetical protein